MPDSRPTEGASFPTSPARHSMPVWYPELLDSVSKRITVGRLRATLAVNNELIATYWAIGRAILDRQAQEGYGTKVIDRLSADLRKGFPDAKGYSPRNLKYMRASRRPGPTRRLCKGALHNCRGGVRSRCWRS